MRPNRFTGKTVIVTGGASGIGEKTVESFAAEGANVVIAEVNEARGKELVARLSRGPGKALFHRTDVTHPDDFKSVIDTTLKTFGRIDVLVNNAGGEPKSGDSHAPVFPDGIKMPLDQWRATFDLNVTAAWLGMSLVIDPMMANGGGVIINISSMLAIRHTPTQSVAYAASKAAVIRLTEVAAARYAEKNIRVNCVAPGLTLTSTLEALLTPEQMAGVADECTAVKRFGRPVDQAAAILYLASDEAAFVTGQTLRVDGGWSVL